MDDIYSLISQEYARLYSDKNIEEMSQFLKPLIIDTFDFTKSLEYTHEITSPFCFSKISFNIQYNPLNDNFKISFKFNHPVSHYTDNYSEILSLMSVISINDYEEYNKVAIKSCMLDDSHMGYNIYLLDDFQKKINEKGGSLSNVFIRVNIKSCYIYSVLTNYLNKFFEKFYYLNSIGKITKQLFYVILKIKLNENINENLLAIALFTWCKFIYISNNYIILLRSE